MVARGSARVGVARCAVNQSVDRAGRLETQVSNGLHTRLHRPLFLAEIAQRGLLLACITAVGCAPVPHWPDLRCSDRV